MNLFINYFHSPERKSEYLLALQNNLDNPLIERVFILTDDKVPVRNDKITIIKGYSRPTFRDFFNEINKVTDEWSISIIANLDIYFDDTLQHAYKMNAGQVYALSRWDIVERELILFDRRDSQDSWIFKGKIRDVVYSNFPLGRWGSDNRLAHELAQNYDVINPAKTIRSIHVHRNETRPERTADNVIPPPYYLINTSAL